VGIQDLGNWVNCIAHSGKLNKGCYKGGIRELVTNESGLSYVSQVFGCRLSKADEVINLTFLTSKLCQLLMLTGRNYSLH